MEKREFHNRIKSILDEIRSETLQNLLDNDVFYKECNEKLNKAEMAYTELDLTVEQREIVDEYLSLTDLSDMEYSTFSYLAGLYDSHKFSKCFTSTTEKPLSKDFSNDSYYDGFQMGAKLLIEILT
ncbi:hypothetical protein [uncultured Robinsoniella sp.]|uniref:hypothetical protein n=1 Tax=uncultured Robinsoniella sp. TaxID=904190 RepID=UPI00374ED6A1